MGKGDGAGMRRWSDISGWSEDDRVSINERIDERQGALQSYQCTEENAQSSLNRPEIL